MIARHKRSDKKRGGNYGFHPDEDIDFFSTGSKLLDLALGGGWAERRVCNIIGDTCLSGDTIISAQRGTKPRKMPLRTLFERIKGDHWNRNSNAETFLLADVGGYATFLLADVDGYAGMAKMLGIMHTGTKTLFEITDDRGDIIKATEDHQFSTPEGWMRLRDNLRVGSYVKRWCGTREAQESRYVRKQRSYTYSIPFHPFGQRNVVGGRDYKRLLTARLILEAAINGMALPELIGILRNDAATAATLQYTSPELDVHHLNGDCTDDRLENLQLVDPEEHWDFHADEFAPNTKAIEAIELAKVVSVTNAGTEPTFDITMEAPHHNFIANGFVVHNSTGKTLLAIEAAINFLRKYSKGKVRYRESEAAFSQSYAASMGLDLKRVDLSKDGDFRTIEDLYEELEYRTEHSKTPELIIVDSLDACTTRAELARSIDEKSYGQEKAKQMSALFRRVNSAMAAKHITMLIVSQTRANIGATMYQRQWRRSGGDALKFYCSQILVLSQMGKLSKTHRGVERTIGIKVKAFVDKCKVGPAYSEAVFPIMFGYGIDDEAACLDYLKKVKRPYEGRPHETIHSCVEHAWVEMEAAFMPARKKYEQQI